MCAGKQRKKCKPGKFTAVSVEEPKNTNHYFILKMTTDTAGDFFQNDDRHGRRIFENDDRHGRRFFLKLTTDTAGKFFIFDYDTAFGA
jgi:hypothetical protein